MKNIIFLILSYVLSYILIYHNNTMTKTNFIKYFIKSQENIEIRN